MNYLPKNRSSDSLDSSNSEKTGSTAEALNVIPEEIRNFLIMSEGVEEFHILSKQDKENTDWFIIYIVPSAQFSEEELYSKLKTALPEINPFCVFVPISCLPLSTTGHIDEDILGRMGVCESALFPEWEEQLRSVSGIKEIAVVEQDSRNVFPSLHLWDLLPDDQALTFNQGGRNPEKIEISQPSDLNGRKSESVNSPTPAISFGGDIRVASGAPATLSETIKRAAELWPAHGTVYTYAEKPEVFQPYRALLHDAERILAGLRKMGLQPRDKVIFQFDDNREFLTCFWGCTLGGFVPVPLGPASEYKPGNSAANKLLDSWKMLERPVVITSSSLKPSIESFSASMGSDAFHVRSFDEMIANDIDCNWHECSPEDVALIMLTSGSTGKPKGVMLRHRNLLSRSSGSAQLNGFSEHDVSLNWMPLDHVAGIIYFHLRDVAIGCQQIQVPTQMILQDPLIWLDLIDRFKATITFAPNFAFGLINDHADELKHRHWDLSSMRFVLNGAEAIVTRTARKFLQLLIPHGLPPSSLYPVWGMSETSSGVTYSDTFSLDTTGDEDPFVEVGAPIPGFAMRIVDSDQQVVSEGVVGSLEVSGSTIMKGYFQRPDLDEEVFTIDGWFKTGDLGFIKGGRLTITGRQKDVIIINSVNYYSHEIEGVVEEIDGVVTSYTAACAVREPGSDTDRLAVFFYSPFCDGEELVETIKEIKSSVYANVGIYPHYVLPVEKEAIPKTEIGKIQRTILSQRFQEGAFREAQKKVELLTAGANTLPNWFFKPSWRHRQPSHVDPSSRTGLCVIFMDDVGLGESLAARLGEAGNRVVTVRAGGSFVRNSTNSFIIQPEQKGHYKDLLQEVQARFGCIDRVFHLWTYAPSAGEPSNGFELEKSLDTGLCSVLFLTQALAGTEEADKTVPFLVVSSRSQGVLPDDEISCEKTMLAGLVETIPREIPWLDCRMIDLPLGQAMDHAEHYAAAIDQESLATGGDRQVAFRNGQRFVWRIIPAAFDQQGKHELPLRKGGMYILSGGLGGIGTEIANFLLQNLNARLLILGRTLLPIDTNRSITNDDSGNHQRLEAYKRLKSAGGDLRYEALDICDVYALKRAVDSAEKYWQCELDGIIHLAGTFHEKPLVEETRESLTQILKPKVQGTLSLHQMIKDRPGSLFLSFASVNGLLGGAMVGGYAAANAFLNGFASYQRLKNGLQSYCLSWSMWDEIGMSRRYHMKDLTRTRGFHVITGNQGIQSWLSCLHHREPQCIIGLDPGNRHIRRLLDSAPSTLKQCTVCLSRKEDPGAIAKLRTVVLTDRFGAPCQYSLRAVEQIPKTTDGSTDRRALSLILEDRVRQATTRIAPSSELERIVADIWQQVLGKEILDIHENFFDLGGSSILMARVAAQLKKKLQLDLAITHLFQHATISALVGYLANDATKKPTADITGSRARGAERRRKILQRRKKDVNNQ